MNPLKKGGIVNYKINYKLIGSLLVSAIGIYLIIVAVIAMHKLTEAKEFSEHFKNFFTHNPDWWNPIIKFFGGKAQEKVAEYDASATICLIVGIFLTIVGAVTALVFGRKKSL